MTTPGAIKRSLADAANVQHWVREGGFTIYVATVGDLPVSPDDDGVFAWVEGEQRLYVSYGGVWSRFGAGPKVVANAAALPSSGNFTGEARITADTTTMWLWTGTYWTPTNPLPLRFASNLAGGDVTQTTAAPGTQATITLAAVPYTSMCTYNMVNFGAIVSGATLSRFYILVDGLLALSVDYDATAASANTRTIACNGFAVLAPNVSHTVVAQCARVSGSGAWRYTATDQRTCRLEVIQTS